MLGVKKEKPRKARLPILRCLPGTGRSEDGREYFGVDLALAQHILGLPANQMPPYP